MDFKLQMGILLAIIGVHLSIFFICGLMLLSVLPRVIYFMWGGVSIGLFCFLVISICTKFFFALGGECE